jgi:hypothetical protein
VPKPEREFSFDEAIPGDSHLAILPPAVPPQPDNPGATDVRVYAQTSDGELMYHALPNARGFLGRLVTELHANDFRDAEHKAHRALAPNLSNWSAHLDIPMWVWRIQVTSVDTGATQTNIVNPFMEMPFTLAGQGSISAEFGGLIGLYREALENRGVAYQFLCFFKIAEGIRNQRQKGADAARERGQQPPLRPSHRVPRNKAQFRSWLHAIYPGQREWDEMAFDSVFPEEARGRKLNDLFDRELSDLRVEVAHALSEDSGVVTLDVDDLLHVARVNKWLPLMKCIVRRWLKDDFPDEFLAHLNEDGSVKASTSAFNCQ